MTPRKETAPGYLGPERERERAADIMRARLASPMRPRGAPPDEAGPLFEGPDLFGDLNR